MIKYILTVAVLVAVVTPASALSEAETAQLKRLLAKRSVEVLGPRPSNFGGLVVTKNVRQEPDGDGKRNCRVVRKRHDAQHGGTFQRWLCP